jgi:hypothetical protein
MLASFLGLHSIFVVVFVLLLLGEASLPMVVFRDIMNFLHLANSPKESN